MESIHTDQSQRQNRTDQLDRPAMSTNDDSGDALSFRNRLSVDVADANKTLFAKQRTSNCKKQSWFSKFIFEFDPDGIMLYREDEFGDTDSGFRQNLRGLLGKRKVVAPKGRNMQIVVSCFQVAQEEPQWPDGDLLSTGKKFEKNLCFINNQNRIDKTPKWH